MKGFLLAVAASMSALGLPHTGLTPGAINSAATREAVCVPGYAKSQRHTSGKLKRQVYLAYGITKHRPGQYEIDHLIPLSLGGADTFANLWPQPTEGDPWNADRKDRLELRLHRLVCSGQSTLEQAQEAFRTDWTAAYVRYVGPVSR